MTHKQLFFRFLKYHKVYYNFLYNLKCKPYNYSINQINNVRINVLIQYAFIWRHTKEGHDFWRDLNLKLIEFYNKFNISIMAKSSDEIDINNIIKQLDEANKKEKELIEKSLFEEPFFYKVLKFFRSLM